MTSRKWTIIKRVFDGATKLDGVRRKTYVEQACPDPAIRREVESLLAAHDKDESFLSVPTSIDGRVLLHYEIRERIGEGGMAVVYKARDTRLERWVALKALQPWAVGHAGMRDLLFQEARSASALNHPNVVTIHEVAEQEGVCFIIMEYVEGRTLNQCIPEQGWPAAEAYPFMTQIVDALAAAHSAGILHGDLTPRNIMVADGRYVKLLDFGLAKAITSQRDQPEKRAPRFRTKVYTAPELLEDSDREADSRSEIFSLGLVLHQMLGGAHAYGSGTPGQIVEAIQTRSPQALPRDIPASLREIIFQCLEKSPERRFQSMNDVSVAFAAGRTQDISLRQGVHTISAPFTIAIESEIQRAVSGIEYRNLPRSRQELANLTRLIERGATSAELREEVAFALRDLILTPPDDSHGVSRHVREIRCAALDVMRAATHGRLSLCFGGTDLEHLDLYGMNFTFERLRDLSFRGCFLVEASFEGSDLRGASFSSTCMRNVRFAGADLTGSDFTEADWFNALGLTAGQLEAVQQDTLMECPTSVNALHEFLENRYVFPFRSWAKRVQEEIKAAWKDYSQPNGVRGEVTRWRNQS